MATIIYSNGTKDVTVPSGEKIAVFSNSDFNVYQQVGYPNFPTQWDLLSASTAGSTYTSDAFSAATVVRVEATASEAFYETGAAPSIAEPQTDITAADATFTISGLSAAQGGYVRAVGGTSSTAGNAGGAAELYGGTPGATGVGGAINLVAAAGGATSGTGGAIVGTAGAGTNGNAAGGAVTFTAGAGQGTGAGGAAGLVAGASGAGATGNGGAVAITSGASSATNGNGGNVVITAGALAGTGLDGEIINRGLVAKTQGAPNAQTVAATLTIANLKTGIITGTHAAGATQAYTLPTGTLTDAGLQFAVGDSFDWYLINLSAAALDTITVTAGVDHTLVGDGIVQSAHVTTGQLYGASAHFRTRKTAANTYVTYRLA